MLERMKIHGLYFVEGDDLQRSFLQARGGDCSFLAIQFNVQVDVVLLLIVYAYGGNAGLVKGSSQGFTTPFQF